MNKIKQFWKNNLEEILQDQALVLMGFLLALTHVIHFIYYSPASGMVGLMQKGSDGVCLPVLADCLELRFLSAEQVVWTINGYGILAILTAALFLLRSRRSIAICSLLVLQLIKNFIIFHDGRLYSAHNYITNFILVLFLFAPDKRRSISILFVLVYFWSGVMHLNPQWINGTLLRENWVFFPAYLEYQTIYVIVLQIIFSWMLLSRKKVLFWFAYLQLIAFHLVSYTAIQWLYPTIMLVLLIALPFFRKPQDKWRFNLVSLNWAVLILFSLLQLIPRLLPNRLQLHGDGRFFYSMHQFNAAVECVSEGTARYKSGKTEIINLLDVLPFLHPRLRCEPVVTNGAAAATCRKLKNDIDFESLSVKLRSKFTGSQSEYETVIDEPDFCKGVPH